MDIQKTDYLKTGTTELSGQIWAAIYGMDAISTVHVTPTKADSCSVDGTAWDNAEVLTVFGGSTLFGAWKKITLDSGKVMCYRA